MMRNFTLILLTLFIGFTLFSCGPKYKSNDLTVKLDTGQKVEIDDKDDVLILDANNEQLAKMSFTQFSIDDNDKISFTEGTILEFTLDINDAISTDNLKVYVNNQILDESEYNSYYHQFRYHYGEVTESLEIKITGLSNDVIRRLKINLPVSNNDYEISFNDTIITDQNKIQYIDYNSQLVFDVVFTNIVNPHFSYEQEGHGNQGVLEENIILHTDGSMTVKIDNVIFNILTIDISLY